MRSAGRRLLLCALLLGAPARASVFDFLPEVLMSREMPRPPGDAAREPTRTILLNGFPLFVTTGKSSRSIKDLLDYYEERYPGGVLKKMTGKPVNVRREGDKTGTLMIVEVPDEPTALEVLDGKRTLVSAGPLRMVYARRSGLQTDYLLAWSDRAMPMAILQPRQSGDAPGQDLPGVPRPLGAARVLSFEEPKAGYRIAMYQLQGSPEAALRSAASRLGAEGWQEDAPFGEAAQKRRKLIARFSKGNRDVVVTARTKSADGTTQLSYLARDL